MSDGDSETVNTGDEVLAVVKRRDCSPAQVGVTLAESHSRRVSINRYIAKEEFFDGYSASRPQVPHTATGKSIDALFPASGAGKRRGRIAEKVGFISSDFVNVVIVPLEAS